MWQMPVPVWMQGTVAFSTQLRISPAPPRGISRSTRPLAVIRARALSRLVSCTSDTRAGAKPASCTPSRRAATMALLERKASLPPRSTQALPLFSARAAASLVTLGRLS